MGVTTDSSQRAFKEEDVVALYNRPRREAPYEYRAVYIGVDPAGGGNSAFSICSLGRTLDGGVTVRFAFAFPQRASDSHVEHLCEPSNQYVGVLAKVVQVHWNECFEQQQCDACGSDARAEFAFFIDEVGGDLVFSVEGEEEEGASADESFGVGCIGGDFWDEVFDVVVQGMGLVQACEEFFDAVEMGIDIVGGVV